MISLDYELDIIKIITLGLLGLISVNATCAERLEVADDGQTNEKIFGSTHLPKPRTKLDILWDFRRCKNLDIR